MGELQPRAAHQPPPWLMGLASATTSSAAAPASAATAVQPSAPAPYHHLHTGTAPASNFSVQSKWESAAAAPAGQPSGSGWHRGAQHQPSLPSSLPPPPPPPSHLQLPAMAGGRTDRARSLLQALKKQQAAAGGTVAMGTSRGGDEDGGSLQWGGSFHSAAALASPPAALPNGALRPAGEDDDDDDDDDECGGGGGGGDDDGPSRPTPVLFSGQEHFSQLDVEASKAAEQAAATRRQRAWSGEWKPRTPRTRKRLVQQRYQSIGAIQSYLDDTSTQTQRQALGETTAAESGRIGGSMAAAIARTNSYAEREQRYLAEKDQQQQEAQLASYEQQLKQVGAARRDIIASSPEAAQYAASPKAARERAHDLARGQRQQQTYADDNLYSEEGEEEYVL